MEREEAIKILEDTLYDEKTPTDYLEAVKMGREALENQKTGHWIRFKEFENGYYHIMCSECGQYWSVDGHAKVFKHCFNCGAKMEGENKKRVFHL